MKYNPHDYQKYATDFIIEKPISAIFLDMGLGKTVISLSAVFDLMLDYFEVSKVLVIAPLRVARSTWPSEINKWEHLKLLSYSVVVGSKKERVAALKEKSHIYIINRENVDWLVNKSGYKFDFDMVVIDELSSFKSYASKRFKSMIKVRPLIKRIVGLTGTPSSNGLMDLWAQFRILDFGERLERFITHFRNKYFLPDKRNGMQIFSYKPKDGAKEEIYERISDMTISMTSSDYLDLPECLYNEVKVELDEKEKLTYKKFKDEMVADFEGKEIDAVNAAALSNKLLQMASGFIYDEEKNFYEIHNKKLYALEDLIEGANGNPVLIAYWYKSDKIRISKRFNVREIKTDKDIADWNNGKIPIALIHPASAGHGLNLQDGGSTFIWFSLTWSLELYQQTNKRLYRQGQKNTVIIHHIVASGTIDERVMKSLSCKDKTQVDLIAAVKAELKPRG